MGTQRKPDEAGRLRASIRLVIQRYSRQARARPWLSILSLFMPGVGNIFVFYLPPLAVAHLLGTFTKDPQPTAAAIAPSIAFLGLAWLTGEGLGRLSTYLLTRLQYQVIAALYIEAMDDLFVKDLGFFHENFAGSLTKKTLGYARRFEDVFDSLAYSIVGNLIPLGFAVVILARLSGWLVLVLVTMLSFTALVMRPLIERRHKLVQIREVASNALSGHVADSISNAETVRAFAREPEEAAIHAHNVHDFTKKLRASWDYQNTRVDLLTSPIYVLTNVLGLCTALMLGRQRGIGIEGVFLTFSYFAQSTRVVWELTRIYRVLETSLTDAAQFTELLLDPPAIVDATPVTPFEPVDTSVRFRDVRFAYGKHEPLFEHFDLHVRAGEKVGLVGRSGGGKTTLTRLLLRFSDVNAGAIEIGGQNIAKIAQASLREIIGSVPQEPAMFHRTIAENIRFARPGASDADVRRAAELAHAADFIEAIPEGYETLVGERGIKLSGGQRQRIAIARAILKDAPILLLDEATSALDSESEQHIQHALWTLMKDRTAIVIAHRLSTVRKMDRLLVLDAGRIVEQGTHDELLAKRGQYAMLWEHQSGGFLADVT